MTPHVHYRGYRLPGRPCACGIGLAYIVYERRRCSAEPLDPALSVAQFTDGGYQWGCGTDGAKQLSVALLADHARRWDNRGASAVAAFAKLHYENFTRRVVYHLTERWELWPSAITEFMGRAVREINGVPTDWDGWIAAVKQRGLLCDGYPPPPFAPE